MRRRTWSTVFAGTVLSAAVTLLGPAPASAAGHEHAERGAWRLVTPWLGNVWSRLADAISLGIDPDGSPVASADPDPGPTVDVSLGIDPNG